jgi:ligand-binding sensor domain-containing protein/signal transduction histidine kinase
MLAIRFFFLFIVLLYQSGQAAELPDIFFKKISLENGLSHRKVNCILKDRRGFMWFGTEDGLNRYDGRYFVSFKYVHNQKNCISGNIISDLYEDQEGILWIATQDGGMTRYDYRLSASRQFKQFRHNIHNTKGIPENGITKIIQDNSGHLWLGTSGSYAVRFNKRTEKFDTPVKKGTKCVLALSMGEQDTLLAGRAGGGLLKINTKTLGFQSDARYNDLYAKLPHVSIPAIFKDKRGNAWLASWDKAVYCIRANGRRETLTSKAFQDAGIAKDDYVSFAEDQDGQIWMAGKQTGVAVYNPVTRHITSLRHEEQNEGSLSDDHVNVVYRDRNGIIWIGTNNGINVFNPLFTPFVQHKLPDRLTDITIYDFYNSAAGDLLIGTSDGIYIKKNGATTLEHKVVTYKGQSLVVTKFFMDEDKQLYIGTDFTLFKYDLKNNIADALPNTDADPVMKKLIDSRIVSIVRDTLDHHPVLLVSPYGHYLTYYDLIAKKWVSRQDSVKKILKRYNIKDNLIRKFYKDRQQNLWMATFRLGLGNWGNGARNVRYYSNDTGNRYSVSNNNVFDIQEDYAGNLWISTYGGGINYFSRKKQKFYHVPESSNLSEGLQLDKNNQLWMLCNGHVHMYDPSIKVYSCYDIPRLEHTGGLSGYIYKDDGGTLYAAGVNYYVTFKPASVAKIDYNPEIFFTDFKVFNQSRNEYLRNQTIELNYDQNQIAIEYAAPEYSGDNLQYSYKLEGSDRDWITAGKRNFVEYANLKGGNYTFKVRATNWKGTFTEKTSTIYIVITPPYWLTPWFYVIVFIVLSSIVYLIYRYRVNELLQQQAIRNGIAQDLHDQIGSTLSSISVYSEVAKKYYEQGKRTQMDDVLDTISTTANEMVTEMGDIVWAINPKNDHLASVLQRVQNYAGPLCNIKGINFIFDYDPSISAWDIGMQNRKNLFLILKETINNAVKHSRCRNLMVSIIQQDDIAELIVKDDGVGFNMENLGQGDHEASLGNGLSNIKSRASELKATIEFKSEQGKGTFLRLTFKRN